MNKEIRIGNDFIRIEPMQEKHSKEVLSVSIATMGKSFMTENDIEEYFKRSYKNKKKNSLVALINDDVIGFSFAYAPGRWNSEFIKVPCTIDELHDADFTNVFTHACGYFKLFALYPEYHKNGIGMMLGNESKQIAREQGAVALLSHGWLESPGYSATRALMKLGGKFKKYCQLAWYEDSLRHRWHCVRCGNPCVCNAWEILIPLH